MIERCIAQLQVLVGQVFTVTNHNSPEENALTRRALLQGIAGASALSLAPGLLQSALAQAAPVASGSEAFISKRPPVSERRFTSVAVEETIRRVKRQIRDPELAWLFENCYPNTLDTTVTFSEKDGVPDTFVITGDIDAMWLRDSSAQVWPYLPLARRDAKLARLIQGVIRRQVKCIALDPYANAFFADASRRSEWQSDFTEMRPGVHERKWEVDSLCYPVRLAHGYWKTTGDTSPFDAAWESAMSSIVRTFREQQRKGGLGPYAFKRGGRRPEAGAPELYGSPVKPIGLICSRFRPSDDETTFQFLVPSNLFAVRSLRQMAEMLTKVRNNATLAASATVLADEVERALAQHARVKHPRLGTVWAYEIDGLGHATLMDDANVPSLLGLPYLGASTVKDATYQATRRLVWSRENPWFFEGKFSGIGGPHIGKDMIWPMSLIMYGLTSTSAAEVANCLRTLKATHGGTGFMHESFHKNNPRRFTRSWFAWANTLFGELVIHASQQFPQVLAQTFPLPVHTPVVLKLPICVVAGAEESIGGFVPDPNIEDGGTNSSRNTIDTSVSNAAPEAVYQSERYGPDFSFSYAVPKNAKYLVRLHFAEVFDAAPGKRIENIDINGQRVLSDLDIAREVGFNKALIKEFRDVAPDAAGRIVIRVSAAAGATDRNAKISALEILPR
jgi:meiotically up-regulated gene 157 (Mug157) protein